MKSPPTPVSLLGWLDAVTIEGVAGELPDRLARAVFVLCVARKEKPPPPAVTPHSQPLEIQ
jgi:hypothetical protein